MKTQASRLLGRADSLAQLENNPQEAPTEQVKGRSWPATSSAPRRPCRRLRDTFKCAALMWLGGSLRGSAASALAAPPGGHGALGAGSWTAQNSTAWEVLGDSHTRRLTGERPAKLSHELVVARGEEDLSWLDKVPDSWHVSVYDQDIDNVRGLPQRAITRIGLVGGQQSYAFGHHIEQHYEALASYTAFVPADALFHSPNFLEVLEQPEDLTPVQALSLINTQQLPPPTFLQRNGLPLNVRAERVSLRTLDSVFYRDTQHSLASSYRSYYRLSEGANLLAHFFANIGLPNWMTEGQDIGTIAHAGMFGAGREQIVQHPPHIYQSLKLKDFESPVVGEIVNKAWLIMLGGPEFGDPVISTGRRHVRPSGGNDAAAAASR